MVITYGAQVSARYHESAENKPELCFIIVPNSSKQRQYSAKKSQNPWITLVLCLDYPKSAMNLCGWQLLWWHRYVSDFMIVIDLRCWWQNHYVGDFFSLCWWSSQCIKSVTNISNLSPTHLVSNIRRQHRCNSLKMFSTIFQGPWN